MYPSHLDPHYQPHPSEVRPFKGLRFFLVQNLLLSSLIGYTVCHRYHWHWLIGVGTFVLIASLYHALIHSKLRVLLFGINCLPVLFLTYFLADRLFHQSIGVCWFLGIVATIGMFSWQQYSFGIYQHYNRYYQQVERREEEDRRLDRFR